jgi:hypothetical protein
MFGTGRRCLCICTLHYNSLEGRVHLRNIGMKKGKRIMQHSTQSSIWGRAGILRLHSINRLYYLHITPADTNIIPFFIECKIVEDITTHAAVDSGSNQQCDTTEIHTGKEQYATNSGDVQDFQVFVS